jgi:hypothetical protein
LEREDHLAPLELGDSKECLELLANLVSLEKMAWLVYLVSQE